MVDGKGAEPDRGGSANSDLTLSQAAAVDRGNAAALVSAQPPTAIGMRPDETVMTMPLASREFTEGYPIEETLRGLREQTVERDMVALDFTLPVEKQ